MFELFTTFESFSAYILLLTCIAVLSIIFESKLVELEDRIRDYFAEVFSNKSSSREKKSNRPASKNSKIATSQSKNKGNHYAA